ncbi:hypothetical protein, partial [Aidingimonas halophila]|uniref:hypothetical protein n=1 Tax=Aidingimonas halophila TaxID=574349 RepID=UPI003614121E
DSTNLSIPITPHDPKITHKTTTSDHHTTGNACASPAADAYFTDSLRLLQALSGSAIQLSAHTVATH